MTSRLSTGLVLLLLLSALPSQAQQAGFFRTHGTQILNREGQPVVLRGLGLGGWLMPEGYMLHVPGYGSPTTIRARIEDLLGPADTERFYAHYRANYVNEADIALIAAWGFDHIRIPFHYRVFYDPTTRTFDESGFGLLDAVLGWCETYGLDVVLDMHAAPGGQNHLNISDSDGTARLWTEPDVYQPLTRHIWEEIARRYHDDTRIIGYDLINEPVLPEGTEPALLRGFYERLIAAVRAIDQNHIIFVEGNWFATDFEGLTPPMDANMVYAFHKYWNVTDPASYRYMLDIRDTHDVPLWLGESGENSNSWFYEVTRQMEADSIGWNWWTHKKIETITSPLSATYAEGYPALIAYWNDEAARPDAAFARRALFEQADNLALERCAHRPDVLAALMSEDFGTTARPYRQHLLPGVINAADFDIGTDGLAYADTKSKNETGTPSRVNDGEAYRNDGVDIQPSDDPAGYAYHVSWIEPGEWMQYTVEITTAGLYDLTLRIAAPATGGRLHLSLDGQPLVSDVEIPATGGWQSWTSVRVPGVQLPAGKHVLRADFPAGGFNFNRMTFLYRPGSRPERP